MGREGPDEGPGITAELLRENAEPRSQVWRNGDWVFKRQAKFLCDNEIYCYNVLWSSGFVPWADREDVEIIRVAYIQRQPVTDVEAFAYNAGKALKALENAGIRHGDLTEYAVLPFQNVPILIDFAESRLRGDPRPDKRPEGDKFWMQKTVEKYVGA